MQDEERQDSPQEEQGSEQPAEEQPQPAAEDVPAAPEADEAPAAPEADEAPAAAEAEEAPEGEEAEAAGEGGSGLGAEAAAEGEELPGEPAAPAAPDIAETIKPDVSDVADERARETGDALEEAAETAGRPRGKQAERGPRDVKEQKAEVIPGEHLEPIRLEQELEGARPADDEFVDTYAEQFGEGAPDAQGATATAEPAAPAPAEEGEAAAPAPAERTPVELAADARYIATGKRKTSVARVILKPGDGSYLINGRQLDEFFPRVTLQRTARAPLEAAGYESRMDVVARIHGGGVSAQADALRHGVARALVEADPNLRGELKRRGFLTRDARAKERKKAGLKKARKRPQFSKR
ncbi:MAG: 30S ribosomal protein S9 [Thermoleophilaceae bacterium]